MIVVVRGCGSRRGIKTNEGAHATKNETHMFNNSSHRSVHK